MKEEKFGQELEAAICVAKEAGHIILLHQGSEKGEVKPDGSIVTRADKLSEKFIAEILGDRFPEYGFLGEEFGERGEKKVRWIVDPLDGTESFILNIPTWTVMIALEVEGSVVLGVIFNPITQDIFTALRGLGAKHNGVKIKVSERSDLKKALLFHSGLAKLNENLNWQSFASLIKKAGSERGVNDSFEWMMIADGRANLGIFMGLGPEDIAAPKIIIEEAGGFVTDFTGENTIYSGNVLISSSYSLHASTLQILRPK